MMANLRDLEQQLISLREEKDRQKCKEGESPEAQLQHVIQYYLTLEDRNRSGAEALGKYYQLGAAEGQSDIVEKSHKSADSTLAKAKNLKAQGLEVALDEAKLYGQKLDLEAQQARVRLKIEELNSDLRVVMGFSPAETEWRFWPADAFQPGDEQVSAATAVEVGLANRPELVLLSYLERELNSDNQSAATQMLRALSGALGTTKSPGKCPMLSALVACLCKHCDDDTREVELRRAQLHEYHMYREREVVEQIGQAVRTIAAETEVVELARREVKSWENRLNEAKDKEQKGIGSFAETSLAEGEWLKAQGKVIEEMANLQRARVLLHQAQGILPAECVPGGHVH
jgi:outer membrane protein TolC